MLEATQGVWSVGVMLMNEPREFSGLKGEVLCLALDRLAKGETVRTPRLDTTTIKEEGYLQTLQRPGLLAAWQYGPTLPTFGWTQGL
jgi:hypothetical protein